MKNCAAVSHGAWWYHNCHQSNLNGHYLSGTHESYADGINWLTGQGQHYSYKVAEMKIRESWVPHPPPTPAAVSRPCGDTEGRDLKKVKSVCCLSVVCSLHSPLDTSALTSMH